MPNVTDTCRSAWDSSKKPHQPIYNELTPFYRDLLSARAEAVLATGLVDDGPFATFEQAVKDAPPEPSASSDQGYEQITDEPFYLDDVSAVEVETEAIESIPEPEDVAVDEPIVTQPAALDEPKPKPKQGKLPSSFPYHDLLVEAGITTYAQARKAEWADVSGIGPARAEEIEEALK